MFRSIYTTIFRGLVNSTYAVTKLDSVDVRLLCVCAVCGRMSLPSVCTMCICVYVSGAPVRVRSGHRILRVYMHELE
jgi:hypothetical protein